jgi:hypothetical protein
MAHDVKIAAAILAHTRGETTSAFVAESFGVTEAQVQGLKDIFQVAGIVAVMNALIPGAAHRERAADAGGFGDPTTTTRHPHHP